MNKNRRIALKEWERLCVHAKYRQTEGQGSLAMERDMEKVSPSTYVRDMVVSLCISLLPR